MRSRSIAAVFWLALHSVNAQTPKEVVPGQIQESEIVAGEASRHRLTLQSEAYFEIEVSSNLDLVVQLPLPDQTPYSITDLAYPPAPETVVGVAAEGGAWTLEIRGVDENASGSYAVLWTSTDPPLPRTACEPTRARSGWKPCSEVSTARQWRRWP